MKNISAWAIRHPLPPIVLFVVLLFMGIVCFVRLPVTADPDISFPGVFIGVGQPGAAPQELETQVMQKVEGAVAGIGNIDNITSWAVEGQANIFIQFEIGTPIDRAVADVRDAVAKVRVLLPQGIQEPTVQRINADGGPMVLYAVSSSSLTEEELSWFVDNTITKRLLQVTGVAQVQRGGGVNREIRVELDPARMQALGITAVEVNEQLRSLNLDSPGGRAQLGGGEQAIRVLGGARTAAALGASQIALSGGRFARLSDLAEVRDGVGEVRTIARLNGRPATTFGVIKAKGYSDVSVDNGMQVELAKIRKENPQVKLTQIFTSVDYTKATYHSALSALLEGSVLAVLVVFLFLRDTRATLISALAIPLSAIPTFAFMQWMDFTLNSISLLALSLVAGVLVDDAIVEIENIVRHMRMGKSGFQAALEAADQIGLAVVATSATIIAVFVPVSFMGGLTGQYFKQFGLTVAAAVFFSLLVARLITPVVAAYTLKSDNVARHTDGPIMAWYQRLLGWCAVHRWKTVLAGLGFLALSAVGVALCSFSFIPESDVGTSFLSVELPPGVRLEDTARVTAAAYRIIARQPEVRDIVESVGTSDEGVRQAELDIALLPASERRVTQRQFEDRVTQELKVIPDAQLHFNRNGNGRDVNIYITGDDPQLTYNTARRVVEEMSKLSFVRDARINNDLPRPEILVHPHLDLASQLGVTVERISETIRIATLGELDQNSAKFSLSDRQVPIRVSLLEESRKSLTTLENLPVPTAGGGTVPLKAVADISFGEGPTRVRRYNQSRRLFIDADLKGAELGDAMKAIYKLPTLKHLPQGVHLVEIGDAKYMNELIANFSIAMATGILMVFAVLVLLFARVLQPITILSSLPLSIGGAVFALLITAHSISLGVMIGFLMLMGIVAKNSILLVDFAIEEMRAGKDRLTAILEAGHKRARPIVMTTVAMIAGMLPVAVGLGGDTAFRQPMAIAVIGGLITSTGLTLVIVPAVFTLIDDIERWLAPRFGRVLTAQPPPAGTQPHPVN
ncbi:MAG: efflux RND transporter permease subunit [Gammaproteobacteria bacterium]|nr:MAG: efflux RND transporter permease subunit [Gammaproteobacteria bacterium]TLZ46365.1 MAG: efflux RND transporter permease subunit [Gammaproteobacteria bacterium]